jgi:hypothetical protein
LPHDHPELNNFINKKFKSKSTEYTKIEIVNESNVDKVVKKIKKQIVEHESK